MDSPIIYAFIDSQNVNLSIQGQGWKLDFKKFRIYLKEKYKTCKAFLFIGYVPTNERLYTALQEDGYILIFKPTLRFAGGTVKGNVDAEIVLHAMIEYPNYDKAILVSGDGDFYCLAKYLRDKNKLGKLIIPNRHKHSSLLREFIPSHAVFMNSLRDKLEYK